MDFINMQNNDGLTAIHYAAFRGNIRILEYLIKNGGNPFIKGKHFTFFNSGKLLQLCFNSSYDKFLI